MAVPTRAEIEAFDVHLRAHTPHVLAASNRLQFAMCLDEDTLSGLCTKMPPAREARVLARRCRNRMTASRLRLRPESGEGGAATADSTPNDDGGSGGVKIEEGDEGAESKREEEPADPLYRKPTDSTPQLQRHHHIDTPDVMGKDDITLLPAQHPHGRPRANESSRPQTEPLAEGVRHVRFPTVFVSAEDEQETQDRKRRHVVPDASAPPASSSPPPHAETLIAEGRGREE
ncbi:hypothetical protein B0A49_04176 [Cryomyces minteri]|uniref:Uncharacterized protein n=1 Tax=Cryomyces minteri TaxID=331657 RepID=A0A4U0XM64_9PEZI|nr:hypothetical protein B0A49_04176 [Cryomyces minteri]